MNKKLKTRITSSVKQIVAIDGTMMKFGCERKTSLQPEIITQISDATYANDAKQDRSFHYMNQRYLHDTSVKFVCCGIHF